MSPIKNPAAYPTNWTEIREGILARARTVSGRPRCECMGECGKAHHMLDPMEGRCIEGHGGSPMTFGGRLVVLTIAHLDHDAAAGDHSMGNLAAYCQACHLRYDGSHNREMARKRREEEAGIVPLFESEAG